MTAFEFVFSLFGLLLGFSLIEVLSGLGKAVKARRKVTIGWLTPLLGLVVMLDLTSFWMIIWHARDAIPPTFESLTMGLLVCGLYYLAAMLVFPDRPEEWENGLDAYYLLHRRQVVGGVALCNLLAHGANAWVGAEPYPDPPRLAVILIFYALLAGVAFVKSKRIGVTLLSALVALYLLGGLAVRLID